MPTKVHTVKAMVFPVVMNACENWTIKKAECQRTEAEKQINELEDRIVEITEE